MPKSQSRRKRMARSKRKAGKVSQTMAVAQQAVAPAQAAAQPQAPASSTVVRTPKPSSGAVAPPISVGRELRRIGILTAIIVVVLVVLARILI